MRDAPALAPVDARYSYHSQLFGPAALVEARFTAHVTDRGLRAQRSGGWASDASVLLAAVPLAATWSHVRGAEQTAFIERAGGDEVALVSLESGRAHANVAARTDAAAADFLADIRRWLPGNDVQDDSVPVRFWAMSPNGPISVRRRLDAPRWTDIAGNYTDAVRSTLSSAVSGFRPGHGGQLLLWHGEPGTGKTWAIRALGREWASWCDVEYVVDPEKFLGSESAYLIQVLLQGEDEPAAAAADQPARWRLLVMEDTGELLTVDAEQRAGKGLSRFLNVVDGFIGQGLRVLVLLTTNERIEQLHPAVARPGRTALELPFGKLTIAESIAWAEARGLEVEASPHTLAELYAVAAGYRQKPRPLRAAGFRNAD